MKTTKSKNSKQKTTLIVVCSTIAALALAVGTYAVMYNSSLPTPQDSQTTGESDGASVDAPDPNDKQNFLDAESEPGNETPPSTTPTSISLEAKDNGQSVTVITNLGSLPEGECTLTISSGESSITKSAPVIYNPEYSTCAGFSIKKSELAAKNWTLKLDVIHADKSYSSTITYEL